MVFRQIRHATCIIEFEKVSFLVDPILYQKNTLDPVKGGLDIKNPLTDIPVPDEVLKNVDAILLTHTHRDHFDPGIIGFFGKDIPIVCSEEYENQLLESGFRQLHTIKDSILFGGIKITLVQGQHGTGAVGKLMGNSYGFILEGQKDGGVYITGDTVWCTCVDQAMEKHNPDYIIAFAGSAMIDHTHITLDADDLKKILSKNTEAKVVAVHMDAWNHCVLTRSELRKEIESDRLLIPEDGEIITF